VSQIPLDLPHQAALGREDFLADASNEKALALIDAWPDWPSHAAILVGPPGCGKSHLAHVWKGIAKAEIFPAALAARAVLAEDCDRGIDEVVLFHTLNTAKQDGGHVLMTALAHPTAWNIQLPDLASRLKAIPVTVIGPPDDGLLRSVLVKLFADRQLQVNEETVAYMVTRMPRSLGAARALVAEIDRQALVERADVTRPFVARFMTRYAEPDMFGED
jgi:chromosomal replication initiation ATPase DnaA